MTAPPCTRYSPGLFDSTEAPDHAHARAICATCPMVMACLDRALEIAGEHTEGSPFHRGPDGTWAGLLWKHGRIVVETAVVEVAA